MIRLPQKETKTLVAIHGWSGVLLGLLLYAVIVTGTAAVFTQEINTWSAGALRTDNPLQRPFDATLRKLAAETPAHYRDDVNISGTTTGNLSAFFHRHEKNAKGETVERGVRYVVAPDGRVVSRSEGLSEDLFAGDIDSALGRFFVDIHVRLHIPNPYGLILTGVLGLVMLLAAVSGLLMHRHIFTDLFTQRGRQRMVGLRDLHTVAATWTLPHAFVLAFTGAFFSFALSIGIPLLAHVAFAGNQEAMIETLVGGKAKPDPRPADSANLDRMIADARSRAGTEVSFMAIEHWGRADAHVTVWNKPAEGALNGAIFTYQGATGAFVADKPALGTRPSAGGTVYALMGPLHFGNFAGWWSKSVWFALGAASAYVTWSGMLLWLRRRDEKPGWRGFGRVTAWVGGGLPLGLTVAAAAYFLALPSGTALWWMPAAFLMTAALALAPALLAPSALIAPVLFGATGLVLLVLPILRLANGGPGWSMALQASQPVIPAVDVLVVIGGLVALYGAAQALRREGFPRWLPAMKPAEQAHADIL